MTNLIIVIVRRLLWIPIDATFFFSQFTAIPNIVGIKNSLTKRSKVTRIIDGKVQVVSGYRTVHMPKAKSFSWAVLLASGFSYSRCIGSQQISKALEVYRVSSVRKAVPVIS